MVQTTKVVAALLSLFGNAVASCDYRTSHYPQEANVPVGKFGYTGLNGPLNWYNLNQSANQLCAKGQNQSPININSSIPTIDGNNVQVHIDSYPNGSTFENLGTTIEVPVNGTLTVDNKTYKLAQFHFHTPSEHRIDLEYFPMELHFVFETDGKLDKHAHPH